MSRPDLPTVAAIAVVAAIFIGVLGPGVSL